MMKMTDYLEGPLYVEVSNVWEEAYCTITNRTFTAYRTIRSDVIASKSNKSEHLLAEFEINSSECECRRVKYGLAELTKIMKLSKLSETPNFFSVTAIGQTYMLGSATDENRTKWMMYIKNLSKPKERNPNAWFATGFLEGNYDNPAPENRFASTSSSNPMIEHKNSKNIGGMKRRSVSQQKYDNNVEGNSNILESDASLKNTTTIQDNESALDMAYDEKFNQLLLEFAEEDDFLKKWLGCSRPDFICGIKLDTLVRFIKVVTAYPFVIVVSSLNLSNKYAFLRSVTGIRIMNILIYVAPVVYVKYVLSKSHDISVQRLAIGCYILLYLFPVAYVVFLKVKVSTSTSQIAEGTFCFKPGRVVRCTSGNGYAIMGFIFEWMQHVLYVFPVGILTSSGKTAKLSDFPPFLSYDVYFWGSFCCAILSGLIIILNAVLRGKFHYKFQNSYYVWFFLYNVGSPLFVTIVTILFMSVWCDYSNHPATLQQDDNIECYGSEHILIARAGLIAVAFYIIQHTLLPSGTFKETMRDDDLDIMFVPVYLQAHFLMKALFCAVYVYFYQDNIARVTMLTIINIFLLALNNFMKPCSVSWVNYLRDCFFVHAVLCGIQSLNYLAWPISLSTKHLVLSTLLSNMLFSSIGMYAYYRYFTKSTEYLIANAFLDLEWQVSRGGSVHPRVLEPLISLTLSPNKEDWEIAKNYIGQLVWLISYPNMRVQFQSAWGLANLALLDEDARVKIHDSGGTKILFEWYTDMEFVVQLETLAALANLTLSLDVAEDMVKRHKCIAFFIELVCSNKLKHATFATIALGNLARKESFRELIRKQGGIPALLGCIMSHDYQKRRHGTRALANMALSATKEIEQVFESVNLIDRILKMANRKEIETQREVIALIRNLSCHARIRPILLDRGVMESVNISKNSVFLEVAVWCDEIRTLLEREISGGTIDLKALVRREGAKGNSIGEADVELLLKMQPLKGQVEWSTWGSKLESIFQPIFASMPTLISVQVVTEIDQSILLHLSAGIPKTILRQYRDSLTYVVVERPSNGKLSEYSTSQDHILYTPSLQFNGIDIITYRMNVGNLETNIATIAVHVATADDAIKLKHNIEADKNRFVYRNNPTYASSPPSKNNNNDNNTQDDDVDVETGKYDTINNSSKNNTARTSIKYNSNNDKASTTNISLNQRERKASSKLNPYENPDHPYAPTSNNGISPSQPMERKKLSNKNSSIELS